MSEHNSIEETQPNYQDQITSLMNQVSHLEEENKALNEQMQSQLNSTQETVRHTEVDLDTTTQNSMQIEIQMLKDKLANKDQELQEAKEKANKTSQILTQSLEKFKKKESALLKSLEELEDIRQLAQQQSVEISELKTQLREAINMSLDEKPKKEEIDDVNQLDEEQRSVFATMVQMSLEKLKIVSKILNTKNPKAGTVSASLEKLKSTVVEKRSEDDPFGEFEKKLKTHFWNIHEVYLSILAKQAKKTETYNDEIDQIRVQGNKSTNRLNYIEDLVQKFIKLDPKEKIHKEIVMAIVDVFVAKPEEKNAFVRNLKLINVN